MTNDRRYRLDPLTDVEAEEKYQRYIACGYIDGMGVEDDAPLIPIDGASTALTLKDKDGDEWTAVIGWTFTDARFTPTTIVLQSQTDKSVTRALLAGLPIGEAVDEARAEQVAWLRQVTPRITEQGHPAPVVADKPKPSGRPMEYGEDFHRRVAEAWFADKGDKRGAVRRIGDRLWAEGKSKKERWPMSEAAFHARVRKAMTRLKDADDPWGFIAQATQTTANSKENNK